MQEEIKRKPILSLSLCTASYQSFIDRIMSMSERHQSSYTCVANVHMCVETYLDPNFASIVNNADIITPDGMPLAKAVKLLYGENQVRVAGMDLLPDLLKEAESKEFRVFFYGGEEDLLNKTKIHLELNYPNLKNHQYYSPPFRQLTEREGEEIVKLINENGTHLVFVILGCPKQEKWMASMKGKINSHMIGIGGALPVLVGLQKRAPNWMQQSSLEWLFRLYQEPTRLLKRYILTNCIFIVLLAKDWLKIKYENSKFNRLHS